jgi:hypothetical protein
MPKLHGGHAANSLSGKPPRPPVSTRPRLENCWKRLGRAVCAELWSVRLGADRFWKVSQISGRSPLPIAMRILCFFSAGDGSTANR